MLALRGDPPRGEDDFTPPEDGLSLAAELTGFITDGHEFTIGGACFPEVHPEADDLASDLAYLKTKVDAGAALPDHPALLRQPRLLRLRRRRARDRDRRADHPRRDPDHRASARWRGSATSATPRSRPSSSPRWSELGGDEEAEALLGRRLRRAPVRGAARRRRARDPLLRAQPRRRRRARCSPRCAPRDRGSAPARPAAIQPTAPPTRLAPTDGVRPRARFRFNGHRIAYADYGEGERDAGARPRPADEPPHVRPARAEMAARGFRVITVDLLGHGASDKPADMRAYSMPAFGDQLAALIDHLELDRPIVGGTSLGANAALEMATPPSRASPAALFIEMPVLDNALVAAGLIFLPILLTPAGRRSRCCAGSPRSPTGSRARTTSSTSLLDWTRRPPESSEAVLEGHPLRPHRAAARGAPADRRAGAGDRPPGRPAAPVHRLRHAGRGDAAGAAGQRRVDLRVAGQPRAGSTTSSPSSSPRSTPPSRPKAPPAPPPEPRSPALRSAEGSPLACAVDVEPSQNANGAAQERLAAEQAAAASERRRLMLGYVVAGALTLAVVVGLVIVLPSGGDDDQPGRRRGDPRGRPHPGQERLPARRRRPTAARARRRRRSQQGDLEVAAEEAGCELAARPRGRGQHPHHQGERDPRLQDRPADLGQPQPASSSPTAPTARCPSPGDFVHSLEHGRIEIQYSPDLSEEDQLALKGVFDEAPDGVLLFPNPEMPYDVAVTAWTQLMTCDTLRGRGDARRDPRLPRHLPRPGPRAGAALGPRLSACTPAFSARCTIGVARTGANLWSGVAC